MGCNKITNLLGRLEKDEIPKMKVYINKMDRNF